MIQAPKETGYKQAIELSSKREVLGRTRVQSAILIETESGTPTALGNT